MSSLRRHRAVLLGALAGALLTGVGTAAPTDARVGAPAATEAADARAGAIDTSDNQAVSDAWTNRMADNLDVVPNWSGSAEDCRAGKPSSEAQDATLESVNFARSMAGLDEVELDSNLSNKAQAAALIMDANDALSHDPPETWACYTQTGAAAAGSSNLAWTSGEMSAGGSVELYLDDPGAGNRMVGHRRWVLNPFATAIGNGLTTSADALYVLGPTDAAATNPDWVSWPTAGWFPSPLEPGGRWSLSSGASGADFSDATVQVTRGSQSLPVRRFKSHDGYAQPTLVFQVRDASRPGAYRVVVRHIRGAAAARHVWTVRLFRP